jgi:NADPH-dependent curcumin reductase CurA
MEKALAWRLAERPHGIPRTENFELVGSAIPDRLPGTVLIANEYISVDPYMRGRMRDRRSYAAPYDVGAIMHGGAVGVVSSADQGVQDMNGTPIRVGDRVLHNAGWRSHAVLPAQEMRVLPVVDDVEPRYFLGAMGMPGLTAYVGLFSIAGMRAGDRVFVSGAAGAVGSLVGQMARLGGASRVVGSAGGPEKVSWLIDELGFDAAIDYRQGDLGAALTRAAPDGVDVYFDNVGGEHLEAALDASRIGARIAKCGSVASYNVEDVQPGPRNMAMVVANRLTIRGFLISDHHDLRPEFELRMSEWLGKGQIVVRETIVEGIENAAEAFISMLQGGNTGKMLVRV